MQRLARKQANHNGTHSVTTNICKITGLKWPFIVECKIAGLIEYKHTLSLLNFHAISLPCYSVAIRWCAVSILLITVSNFQESTIAITETYSKSICFFFRGPGMCNRLSADKVILVLMAAFGYNFRETVFLNCTQFQSSQERSVVFLSIFKIKLVLNILSCFKLNKTRWWMNVTTITPWFKQNSRDCDCGICKLNFLIKDSKVVSRFHVLQKWPLQALH